MLSTVPFSTLARETRLRIHLCSLVKREKNAHSVFAWCNLQLFDFHDRMPRGELRIDMWRTDDGVIGTTASSPSPLSPQLVLRFLEPLLSLHSFTPILIIRQHLSLLQIRYLLWPIVTSIRLLTAKKSRLACRNICRQYVQKIR